METVFDPKSWPYLVVKQPADIIYYYVRLGPSDKHFRVKGRPDSVEFMTNYQAALKLALKNRAVTEVRGFNKHRVNWLIEKYLHSAHFLDKRPNTQRNYQTSLRLVNEFFGHAKYGDLRRVHIAEFTETISHTPAVANQFLSVFRSMIAWAIGEGYVKENILTGIPSIPYQKRPHEAWTEEEMQRFANAFDFGTQERLAFELLSNLGARPGDVIKLKPENIQGDEIHYISEKTGLPVTIVMSEDLKQALQGVDPNAPALLLQPRTKTPFKNHSHFYMWFRRRCMRLGIRKPPHGIRKTVACRQLVAGATIAEGMSTQGWVSPQTLIAYARTMDRRKIGKRASKYLVREKNIDPDES